MIRTRLPVAGFIAAFVAPVAACGGAADPCGDAPTCLVIDVEAPFVDKVDQITLDLVYNGVHGLATTGMAGVPQSLPATTAVILDVSNNVLIEIEMLVAGKLGGSVVAGGSASIVAHPGQHDTATVFLSRPPSCNDGALYCGGVGALVADEQSLYVCTGGFLQFDTRCDAGCTPRFEPGAMCNGTSPCLEGGHYCGGDVVDGDPGTLYVCHDHAPTSPMHCPTACQLDGGGDDFCR